MSFHHSYKAKVPHCLVKAENLWGQTLCSKLPGEKYLFYINRTFLWTSNAITQLVLWAAEYSVDNMEIYLSA